MKVVLDPRRGGSPEKIVPGSEARNSEAKAR